MLPEAVIYNNQAGVTHNCDTGSAVGHHRNIAAVLLFIHTEEPRGIKRSPAVLLQLRIKVGLTTNRAGKKWKSGEEHLKLVLVSQWRAQRGATDTSVSRHVNTGCCYSNKIRPCDIM